jgi:hypothetical protein
LQPILLDLGNGRSYSPAWFLWRCHSISEQSQTTRRIAIEAQTRLRLWHWFSCAVRWCLRELNIIDRRRAFHSLRYFGSGPCKGLRRSHKDGQWSKAYSHRWSFDSAGNQHWLYDYGRLVTGHRNFRSKDQSQLLILTSTLLRPQSITRSALRCMRPPKSTGMRLGHEPAFSSAKGTRASFTSVVASHSSPAGQAGRGNFSLPSAVLLGERSGDEGRPRINGRGAARSTG